MKQAKAQSAVASRETKAGSPVAGALQGFRNWPRQVKSFWGDVRSETKRVTWPGTKQIRATTLVVILTVFLFGVYFGGLDRIYGWAVGWLLRLGG